MSDCDFRYMPVDEWERPAPEGGADTDYCDVAVAADGHVLVLARGPGCVIVLDRDGDEVDRWGADVLSNRPHGLSIAENGDVYCADEANHVVHRFDCHGTLLRTIGTPGKPSDTGADWSLPGERARYASVTRGGRPFNRPTQTAATAGGDLYVTDGYANARVHHFDRGGELVRSWGAPGSGPGELRVPHGICISGGRVHVADRENDRVQVFDLDGELMDTWDDLQRPACIVADADGMLLVSELQQPVGHWRFRFGDAVVEERPARIAVVDPRGRVVERLGMTGPPCAAGSFASPHGIAVNAEGDLYVAEAINSYRQARGGADGAVPHACHGLQKLTRSAR